jgi:hypothetical protein
MRDWTGSIKRLIDELRPRRGFRPQIGGLDRSLDMLDRIVDTGQGFRNRIEHDHDFRLHPRSAAFQGDRVAARRLAGTAGMSAGLARVTSRTFEPAGRR